MAEEITSQQEVHLEEVYDLQRAAYQHDLKGEVAAALSLKRDAQLLEESILGSEHPYVARSLEMLATDLYENKHYVEAERLFRRALRIFRQTSGEVTEDVASVYEWLAYIYDDQRQWRKALAFWHDALAIRKRCSNNKYFEMAMSLRIYADLLRVTGRKVRGKAILKRAKAMRRR